MNKLLSNIRHSMSANLSVGILLMAIPVFILALGILFLQSRYFIRKESSNHVSSVLNTTTHHVVNYMSAVATATNSNTWLVEDHFDPKSMEDITHQIVRLNRHVDGCTIAIEPGMFPEHNQYLSAYTVHTGDTTHTASNVANAFDKAWYKMAQNAGKACWVDPFHHSATSDHFMATYCRPLYLNDKFVGVIASDLSLQSLAKAIEKAGQPFPEAYYVLVNGNGQYLLHPDPDKLTGKSIFTDVDPNHHSDRIALGHEMTAGNKGTMHVNINGKLSHVCYQPVPGTDWSLALVCPDSNILKSYHLLAYIITAIIAIGLLIILLIIHRIVERAIKPLNDLVDMTKQIAAGNYDTYIPLTHREDSIGDLQNSFAAMQQSLNFHMGGIRHTTEETKKRNEELARVTKLAEESLIQKTAFIQNVSHQIRTPLNIIMGFAQVLCDSMASRQNDTKSQPTDKEDEFSIIADTMRHNASHLERMVLMLFDSSDIGLSEELKIQRDDQVSCNEIAREGISHSKRHFPTIDMQVDSELPDSVCIQTNRLYLMRTIRELLYNAAKYSDGKHIVIRIRQTETTVRFIVEDVGPGISKELKDLIFKPFLKVNDLSEGLGLGLPLAKRHAISLGGDLQLDTSYLDGCRFIVEIPR